VPVPAAAPLASTATAATGQTVDGIGCQADEQTLFHIHAHLTIFVNGSANFFDEWGLPLGPDQVGRATGHVVAIYNGQVYQGNPRDIPLNAHAQIQLEVGTPLIAPQQITFPSGV
jgi:hypothetical protein